MEITTTKLQTNERKVQPTQEDSIKLYVWLAVNETMGIQNTMTWLADINLIVEMSITSTTLSLAQADEQLNNRSKNFDLLFP